MFAVSTASLVTGRGTASPVSPVGECQRQWPTVNAAIGVNRLLRVHKANSGQNLLVDSGAEFSLLPPSGANRRCHPRSSNKLITATGSPIALWGSKLLRLDFGVRMFFWEFCIADVTQPILGADFLAQFALAVNVCRQVIVHLESLETISCCCASCAPVCVTTAASSTNKFASLLDERPALTTLMFRIDKPLHGVYHHIQMTPPLFLLLTLAEPGEAKGCAETI